VYRLFWLMFLGRIFLIWLIGLQLKFSNMMFIRSARALLFWYCYIFEYFGAFVDLAASGAFPFLFWFAPDRILFVLNLLVFVPYGFLLGVINQAIALKFAYNRDNYRSLLFYTPFYRILRLINIMARLTSSVKYCLGDHGNWHSETKSGF
jgi:hypothetical protein